MQVAESPKNTRTRHTVADVVQQVRESVLIHEYQRYTADDDGGWREVLRCTNRFHVSHIAQNEAEPFISARKETVHAWVLLDSEIAWRLSQRIHFLRERASAWTELQHHVIRPELEARDHFLAQVS